MRPAVWASFISSLFGFAISYLPSRRTASRGVSRTQRPPTASQRRRLVLEADRQELRPSAVVDSVERPGEDLHAVVVVERGDIRDLPGHVDQQLVLRGGGPCERGGD